MKECLHVRLGAIMLGAIALVLLVHPPSAQAQSQTRNAVCSGATAPTDPGVTNYFSLGSALGGLPTNSSHAIYVLGTCAEVINLNNFQNLSIRKHPSAAVAEIVPPAGAPTTCGSGYSSLITFNNTSGTQLENITVTGGRGLRVSNSTVTLAGVTVQNSLGDGINLLTGSKITLDGPAGQNFVTSNCGNGITAGSGSAVDVRGNNDITDNGGAAVQSSAASVNVFGGGGTVTIARNSFGIRVNPGSAVSVLAPVGTILIDGNKHYGISVVQGAAITMFGNVIVQGNMAAPTLSFVIAHPAGIYAEYGAILNIFAGVKVQGNFGAGIAAHMKGIVGLGNAAPGITVSGNTGGGLVLTQSSIAESFPGNVFSGNTGADASCDNSSELVGDVTGIGVVNCARNR